LDEVVEYRTRATGTAGLAVDEHPDRELIHSNLLQHPPITQERMESKL